MVILSVYDEKGKNFVGGLVLQKNVECGLRWFSEICMDKQSAIAKFPEDFSLYMLGEFDENSGSFKLLEKPTKLQNAKEVLANG